jgi:hypothetical protein
MPSLSRHGSPYSVNTFRSPACCNSPLSSLRDEGYPPRADTETWRSHCQMERVPHFVRPPPRTYSARNDLFNKLVVVGLTCMARQIRSGNGRCVGTIGESPRIADNSRRDWCFVEYTANCRRSLCCRGQSVIDGPSLWDGTAVDALSDRRSL